MSSVTSTNLNRFEASSSYANTLRPAAKHHERIRTIFDNIWQVTINQKSLAAIFVLLLESAWWAELRVNHGKWHHLDSSLISFLLNSISISYRCHPLSTISLCCHCFVLLLFSPHSIHQASTSTSSARVYNIVKMNAWLYVEKLGRVFIECLSTLSQKKKRIAAAENWWYFVIIAHTMLIDCGTSARAATWRKQHSTQRTHVLSTWRDEYTLSSAREEKRERSDTRQSQVASPTVKNKSPKKNK